MFPSLMKMISCLPKAFVSSKILGRGVPLHGSRTSSRGSARGSGVNKGKSPEATEIMEEDEDVIETDDVDSRGDISDYHTYPSDVLESMFRHYSAEEANSPSAVLHFASVAALPYVRRMTRQCNFSFPYAFRTSLPNESMFLTR